MARLVLSRSLLLPHISTKLFALQETSHVKIITANILYRMQRHHSHCLRCERHRLYGSISGLRGSFKTDLRYFSQAFDSDDENERLYGEFETPDIELDWAYISDPKNREEIHANILNRKGIGDINKVQDLLKKQSFMRQDNEGEVFTSGEQIDLDPVDFYQYKKRDLTETERDLWQAALSLPNKTHPAVRIDPACEGTILSYIGTQKEFNFMPRTVVELGEHLNALRVNDTSVTTGPHTYYLMGVLAMMEQALIQYSIDVLKKMGFRMMSVPDLIYPQIIEGCGFNTEGERNQIYRLDPDQYGDVCLSGTGEIPLAGFCTNHGFAHEELPQKLMAVSRCYRAETTAIEEYQGIYRVHQFTKVEMFALTEQDLGTESEDMMEYMLDVQKQLFTPLGLALRVLDMHAHQLGSPAYRKYDIEAWMPAKRFWGEISSTSNCTDHQSRRLDIRYWNKEGNLKHCHTVNGTACAVPRMIMAILETHQQQDKSILVPEVLQPYMDGMKVLELSDAVVMKPIKFSNNFKKQMKTIKS